MSCVPILGRKKRYHFEAVVRLHKLISVPYVNAVTFAKLRLLNTRHSSQYSPRAETHNHTVSWDTEHRFLCRFESNPETNILEPKILKISIRMETKGGKSFNKVGFVSVNLACFAGMGNVVSRRRYILEGYDERHKRQDNSLLLLSFSMRQLFGDTCFRIPTENLSKCLMEPSDSEEVEAVGPDGCCANVNSYADLMNSELLPEGRRSFDRVLHSLNLDPLVVASQNSKSTPSLQLTQQNPAVATFLANAVNATENGRRPLFPIPVNSSLSPDQLVTLLTGVFPSQQLAPAAEEIRSELSRSPMCDTLGAAIDRSVCKSVTQEDSGRTKHHAKGCSSDRDPHCSVTLEHPITEASPPLLKQMQTFEERGADRQESEMGRTQHTTATQDKSISSSALPSSVLPL
ncbi:unnamed protein product [Calicophoron daubneyi]|uniref:C2 NT-type domain-containing protein n=1 Tax=Calicophoron daubneyi TaxID=300641 RepID=A0AAV2TTG4_CALDB